MNAKKTTTTGILLAVLAAALYAVNAPFSKLLLDYMPSTLMAGFLYVGAGLGMGVIALIRKAGKTETKNEKIGKADLPYTIVMIVLDIAAPSSCSWGCPTRRRPTRHCSTILRS